MALLRTPARTRGDHMATVAEFEGGGGRAGPLVLSHQGSHLPLPEPLDAGAALAATEAFWRDWLAKSKNAGEHAEAVRRSLITLKAMTFAPTGGVVAAPTTSLPEQFGGTRNWDDRFCWMPDRPSTLLSMMNSGYYDEASLGCGWCAAVAGDPADMQIMYGLGGERRLTEWTADWLPGHAHSRRSASATPPTGSSSWMLWRADGHLSPGAPRRPASAPVGVGPAARPCRSCGQGGNERTRASGSARAPQADHHSRVMASVAVDRAIKSAELFGLPGPVDDWRALCARISRRRPRAGLRRRPQHIRPGLWRAGPRREPAAAGAGRIPRADDPRFVGTVEAIERELLVDGFVQRYLTEKG